MMSTGLMLIVLLWMLKTLFFPTQVKAKSNSMPIEKTVTKELATYMGELQRLTHKLNLSVNAKNEKLIDFYRHESLALLEEIQNELPIYEELPVALYIDRFAYPAYEALEHALKKETKKNNEKSLNKAMQQIIDSCNHCHKVTHFEFLKIVETKSNPFNQSFNP